jgi:hypothetical protein
MNAQFDEKLKLTNGGKTVEARGPCLDWRNNDKSAVIENVKITQGSVVASSSSSTTVQKAGPVWSLDVSSSSQLTPGSADAYAHVTVTRQNGQEYNPPCGHFVVLIS